MQSKSKACKDNLPVAHYIHIQVLLDEAFPDVLEEQGVVDLRVAIDKPETLQAVRLGCLFLHVFVVCLCGLACRWWWQRNSVRVRTTTEKGHVTPPPEETRETNTDIIPPHSHHHHISALLLPLQTTHARTTTHLPTTQHIHTTTNQTTA